MLTGSVLVGVAVLDAPSFVRSCAGPDGGPNFIRAAIANADGAVVVGTVTRSGVVNQTSMATTGRLRALALEGSNDFGDVGWINSDTLVYLAGGGDDDGGRIVDVPSMTEVRRIHGWYAAGSKVVAGSAYGVGWGRVMWVRLPSPNPVVVDVPGDTWAVEAIGGDLEADPRTPLEADLSSEVRADDVTRSAWQVPDAVPFVAVAALAVGLVVAWKRRRRSAA